MKALTSQLEAAPCIHRIPFLQKRQIQLNGQNDHLVRTVPVLPDRNEVIAPRMIFHLFCNDFPFISYFLPQSDALPVRISSPCSSAGRMYSRLSRTAFGLPGRLMIRVDLRMQAAARLNMARGVMVIL